MPRATIICGTADTEGMTAAMCDRARIFLLERKFEVSLILPSELEISHCRDCGRCERGGCVIDDDMSAVMDAFGASDVLVLATPIHFSSVSSVLKTVMDRFQPFWYKKGSPRPRFCFSLMCGGSKEPDFATAERTIRAFCIMLGMEYLGSAKVKDTDTDRTLDETELVHALWGITAGMGL
jgi:multimeric flavodoxin WrbA